VGGVREGVVCRCVCVWRGVGGVVSVWVRMCVCEGWWQGALTIKYDSKACATRFADSRICFSA
jgi:hypothetical protein